MCNNQARKFYLHISCITTQQLYFYIFYVFSILYFNYYTPDVEITQDAEVIDECHVCRIDHEHTDHFCSILCRGTVFVTTYNVHTTIVR